ncbi:hypothetical protein C8J56DRAFT_736065, partial [Mycena floridula]
QKIVNPVRRDYFYATRSALIGKPLNKILPPPEREAEEWKVVEGGFTRISGWYEKDSIYINGTEPTFSDFI